MNIRNVLSGSRIRTRVTRDYPDAEHYILMDNYWNRTQRLCRTTVGNLTPCFIPSIDIDQVFAPVSGGGMGWVPVTLTKAQQKRLQMQRHLEYVTSSESETYWAS